MTTLQIKLFGALEIAGDNGIAITGFRSQKALTLLAYLICTGRPVTRDYLAGLAWPDMPQPQALGLLRRTLHDLVGKLPGCLLVDRRTVQVQAAAPLVIDLHQYVLWAAQDDPIAWAQAVELYRAPFLEGVYLDDCAELENWLSSEQEYWQQQTVALLERLILHHMATGAYARALHYARRQLALEPWREEAHSRVMLLLSRTGQRSAALSQYHTCRRVLWQELAVEPAPSTQTLYRRIQSAVLRPLQARQASVTPLFGREDEMAQLVGWLADPHCRLVTLVGVGGMGKTRLALEVMNTVDSDTICMFLHGIVFVALAGIDDGAQLAMAVAQALGLTVHESGTPDDQVMQYLRDKELLLVLDNVEQLIGAQSLDFLTRLLVAAPDVKVLVTSRVRLGLHCEQLYWLQGLAAPPLGTPLTPDGALAYGALRLWLETARRRRPGKDLSATDLPAITTIANQVQGLPLALELAAARCHEIPLDAIARQIMDNLDFLATHAPDLPARQRSMRAVFQTTWRLLTLSEQAVFARLAVFRGGFTADLAQAVAGVDATTLAELEDKSLVRRTAGGRYTIHELLRQFAAEELIAFGELPATQHRHAAAMLAFVERIDFESRHCGTRPGLAALKREDENLQAALHWCFSAGESALGLALVATLSDYWYAGNNWREGHRWQTQALAVSVPDALQPARAAVLNELGVLLGLMGEIEPSRLAHEESLRSFTAQGDTHQQAWVLYYLACPEYQDEDHAKCNDMLYTALATFREFDDKHGIVVTLWRLSLQMLDGTEDLVQAEVYATESLAMARRLDLRSSIASPLILLGEIAIRRGELARAEAYLAESCSFSEPRGGLRSWAMGKLGHVLLKQGKLSEARATFQEVLEIRQELGSIIGVAWMLEALGEVAVAGDDYTQAGQMFGAAATLRARYGQPLLAVDKRTFDHLLQQTQTALGAEQFAAAWSTGAQLAKAETDFVALFGQPETESTSGYRPSYAA